MSRLPVRCLDPTLLTPERLVRFAELRQRFLAAPQTEAGVRDLHRTGLSEPHLDELLELVWRATTYDEPSKH